VVLQDHFLWNASIEDNIRYGNDKVNRDEIIASSNIAGVNDFMRELNLGYDFLIGENASKVSEGQKQKIAIARALVKKPRILLLDEAFSCMDRISEERIVDNIIKSGSIKILIFISHRIATIRKSDSIYFLSDSKLEIGSFDHLFSNNKLFSNLFSDDK